MNSASRVDKISTSFTRAIQLLSRLVLGPVIMLLEIGVSAIFYYSLIVIPASGNDTTTTLVLSIILAIVSSAVKTGIWNNRGLEDSANRAGRMVAWIVITIHAATILGGASLVAGGESGKLFPTNPSAGQVVVVASIATLCIGNKLVLDAMFGRKPNLKNVKPIPFDQDEIIA